METESLRSSHMPNGMFSRMSIQNDDDGVQTSFVRASSGSEFGLSERTSTTTVNTSNGGSPTSSFLPDRQLFQRYSQPAAASDGSHRKAPRENGIHFEKQVAPTQQQTLFEPSSSAGGFHATQFQDLRKLSPIGSFLQRSNSTPSEALSPQRPHDILVTADSDAYQSATMLTYILSQPGVTHCTMHIHAPNQHPSIMGLYTAVQPPSPQSLAAAKTALHAVFLASQSLSTSQTRDRQDATSDLFLLPFLSLDGSISILVIPASLPAASWQLQGTVLPLEAGSSPLVKALELASTVLGSGQQAEVPFNPKDALLLLQAAAVARMHLHGSCQELLLLPVQMGEAEAAAGNMGLAKLLPAAHILSAKQLQQVAALVQQHQAAAAAAASASPWGDNHSTALQQQGAAAVPGWQAAAAYTAAAAAATRSASMPSGMSPDAAAAAAAAAAASVSAQQQHMVQQHQRVRKADYVIVTEDTAIKNAAGAIAKVLGRVCEQGHCCPVFTERKTGQPTTVVSVAVKAIAVARSYVDNEGGAHKVAFQPYLRMLGRTAENARGFGRRSAGACLPEQQLGSWQNDGYQGPSLIKSTENVDVDPNDPALTDEHSELAFDVFKVPVELLLPLPEDGSLPVKVTAHSRAGVVSNIITKLVSERGSAVLITAGGRAMHVAMMATMAARARLRAGRAPQEILLLPAFVTVDTKGTLGWESVFLKFHIVRTHRSLLVSESVSAANVPAWQREGMPRGLSTSSLAPFGTASNAMSAHGSSLTTYGFQEHGMGAETASVGGNGSRGNGSSGGVLRQMKMLLGQL